MNLLSLPTDILLHLLNRHFSLHQLFHLRLICTQLCDLIECRHCICNMQYICNIGGRVSLKLFWSFRDIERYTSDLFFAGLEMIPQLQFRDIGDNDDDLVLNADKLCPATVELFVRVFVQVRHLVVYFTYEQSYPDYLVLTTLLDQWRGKLLGLSLFGMFRHRSIELGATKEQNSAARVTFAEAINQLDSLKHLDMDLGNLFTINNLEDIKEKLEIRRQNDGNLKSITSEIFYDLVFTLPARLTRILPRLERLYLRGTSEHLCDNVLRHLGPSCTWLALVAQPLDKTELRTVLTEHAHFRLTNLRLQEQVDLLGEHFCAESVESLSLQQNFDSPIDTTRMLCKLSQLRRLTTLQLVYFNMNLFFDSTSTVRLSVPILARITSLSIWFLGRCSDSIEQFRVSLQHTFPNVIHFTLKVAHSWPNFTLTHLHPSKLIVSLRHCAHYRLFLTYTRHYKGTFEGLLSRKLRERFQKEKVNGYRYDTMLQWKRKCPKRSSIGQWVEIDSNQK